MPAPLPSSSSGGTPKPERLRRRSKAGTTFRRTSARRSPRWPLRSFEARDEFLEGVAVADTVLVLQRLAAERGLAVVLPVSVRLPS